MKLSFVFQIAQMKTKIILFLILLLLYILLISLYFFGDKRGPHDGVLKEVDSYVVEFKEAAPTIFVFLLDHNLKSIANKNISAQVFVVFTDGTTLRKYCQPYGSDGFSVDVGLMNFATCKVGIVAFGKVIETTFSSEKPWAKNFK
jgi:hypothetical protein